MLMFLRRKVRKLLIQLGLKKKLRPNMETNEGHLGGYIIGSPAPGTWCPEIWDWSINELGIKSMLDVGCGLGYAMQYFDRLNIETYGVDGSPSAIEKNVMNKSHLTQHDYTNGPWTPEKSYDLIWSSEFLEHVEQQYEAHFLETFKYAKKYLMVTFAIPGQGGHHHVNEQFEPYWIERIEQAGFQYHEQLTRHARSLLPNEGNLGMQFKTKGLVFTKSKT